MLKNFRVRCYQSSTCFNLVENATFYVFEYYVYCGQHYKDRINSVIEHETKEISKNTKTIEELSDIIKNAKI
ncbi:hypothetical protein [Cetobacterium sp.]|uniref:hypothetical protein n=1 Tax=Cetobacterium sp. TaxID=2071632 RepID=UPI003F3A7BB1